MARLALRQFLRSSFDLGDKTMAPPIIACLGAATLLLASCCFTSITAANQPDFFDDDDIFDIEPRIQPPRGPPPPPPSGAKGFVRVSAFSPPLDSGIPKSGARSLHGRPRFPIIPKQDQSRMDEEKVDFVRKAKSVFDAYIDQLRKNGISIIDIATKEFNKGIRKVARFADVHENGVVTVKAETKLGKAVGMWTMRYLKQFFKDRWVAMFAHIAQEATDRFISGSRIFFAKTDKLFQ